MLLEQEIYVFQASAAQGHGVSTPKGGARRLENLVWQECVVQEHGACELAIDAML